MEDRKNECGSGSMRALSVRRRIILEPNSCGAFEPRFLADLALETCYPYHHKSSDSPFVRNRVSPPDQNRDRLQNMGRGRSEPCKAPDCSMGSELGMRS